MSLDRRIVSILYFNNIFDIQTVENFIRVDENYYEAIINSKLEKLKIPGKEYFDEVKLEEKYEKVEKVKKISNKINKQREQIADLLENNIINEDGTKYFDKKTIDKIKPIAEKTVEEQFLEVVKEEEPIFTTTIYTFEEELEKTEIENQDFLSKINKNEPEDKKIKNKPKISNKKIKIEESNLDAEIDDFLLDSI